MESANFRGSRNLGEILGRWLLAKEREKKKNERILFFFSLLYPSFHFPLDLQSRTADEVSTLSIGYTAFKYCLYRVPISEGFRCGIRVLVTVDEFDVRKNFASPRYDLREWNLFIGLSVPIFHGKFRIKRLGISGLVASGMRTESAMKYCFTNIAYLAFLHAFSFLSRE